MTARIFALALSRCSFEMNRRSPAAHAVCAITFVFPRAVPLFVIESSVASVPPTATLGLNVRYFSPRTSW